MPSDTVKKNIEFQELFQGVEFHEEDVSVDIKLPDSFFYNLTDFFMERSYLNTVTSKSFAVTPRQHGTISWLKINQLPINPDNSDRYDLLSRWQGVLSTLHAWDYRLIFLLLRKDGKTTIYLGTSAFHHESDGVTVNITAQEASEQVREAAAGSMPGIGLEPITDPLDIGLALSSMPYVGAITGIPSFRDEDKKRFAQTLDPLAFGLKNAFDEDRDYALLVIADPIKDSEVAELIRRHRELSTRIHTEVKTALSTGKRSTDQNGIGVGAYEIKPSGSSVGRIIGEIIGSSLGVPDALDITKDILGFIKGKTSTSKEKKISLAAASSVNKEYMDQYAAYAEQLINKHINRLNEGRNLGFWNTGIYLLGGYEDVRTAAGLLRSVYSGKESYLEPIRIHCFPKSQEIDRTVKSFNLLSLVDKGYAEAVQNRDGFQPEKHCWHILGKPYQYVSTPMNTAELSLATSLPRCDVPGLRFTKTAVRFAGSRTASGSHTVPFGNIVDMGVRQSATYSLALHRLSRHALITGSPGSGKTVSAQHLLDSIRKNHIPFLVIEPSGDDYVRWAAYVNRSLPTEQQIHILMPGNEKRFPDTDAFSLNLFQPAGRYEDLLSHSETLCTLLKAYLPYDGIDRTLLEEACISAAMTFNTNTAVQGESVFPTIDLLIQTVLDLSHKHETKETLSDSLVSGLRYLKRGLRGRLLDCAQPSDFDLLFSSPTVLNLSHLTLSEEKALIMSLLLLALYEYRSSAYRDSDLSEENRLQHLTLIEEAHLVFSSPSVFNSTPISRAAVLLSDMLPSFKNYGEGLTLVEQSPCSLRNNVIQNIDLKITHRLISNDDRSFMESELSLNEDQKTLIPALDVGNAIIYGNMDNAATWIKIPTSKIKSTKDFKG